MTPLPRCRPRSRPWRGSPELERGTRLAIDVGSVRVGVARSDPDGILAVPEATLTRDGRTIERIGDLVAEHGAVIVYVGLPLGLDGQVGAAGAAAEAFGADLARALDVPVRLVDERLSTVTAQRSLREAGRSTRESRGYVDQAAAVVILEGALARERADGTRAGRGVTF
ncbi:MAG: Holliday junction resolvase RuvX [Actinobacteria bacterium]|nr:Holliday junction resolvase RuvX [Actinomycetota bacterium]